MYTQDQQPISSWVDYLLLSSPLPAVSHLIRPRWDTYAAKMSLKSHKEYLVGQILGSPTIIGVPNTVAIKQDLASDPRVYSMGMLV
ncbi:hypothetical protein H4R33_007199, partial [Dimargaris cristalligena]